jgi:hypothetical protein
VSGLVKSWAGWVEFLRPLIDKAPEFFPLLFILHRSYPTLFRENEHILSNSSFKTKWSVKSKTMEQGSVLLIDPVVDRPNYLGACYDIAELLKNTEVYYLQSSRRMVELDQSSNQAFFSDQLQIVNLFRTLRLALLFLRQASIFDRGVARRLLRAFPKLVLWLIVIQSRLKGARKLMREYKVTCFLTPNEQTSFSSVFVAAAKLEGIKTCQFLHGMPTLLYTPFLSDSFWLWGERTRQMLSMEGAEDTRFQICGAYEFTGKARYVPKESVADSRIRVLFCSQLSGSELWMTDAFEQSTRLVAETFSSMTDYEVVLRFHPAAKPHIKEMASDIFRDAGCVMSISKFKDLHDDVAHSGMVCTASSSAILESLIQRIPAFLVWNKELESIHGKPFLPKEMVVVSRDEFKRKMRVSIAEECYKNALLGLVGANDANARLAAFLDESA